MFDPEEFVARCREALADPDPAAAARDVVARAVSRPAALPEALRDTSGGPRVWFQSPQLTVQCITWPNGLVTPPHEHRMWAVVGVLEGQEDNELWRRTPGGLERAGGRAVVAGEVIVLGADAVHAVSNPCRFPTVGLHVYGGDITTAQRSEWDFDGRNEHPFDMAAVRRFIGAMDQRARELARDLDFEEVQQASFELYRTEVVR